MGECHVTFVKVTIGWLQNYHVSPSGQDRQHVSKARSRDSSVYSFSMDVNATWFWVRHGVTLTTQYRLRSLVFEDSVTKPPISYIYTVHVIVTKALASWTWFCNFYSAFLKMGHGHPLSNQTETLKSWIYSVLRWNKINFNGTESQLVLFSRHWEPSRFTPDANRAAGQQKIRSTVSSDPPSLSSWCQKVLRFVSSAFLQIITINVLTANYAGIRKVLKGLLERKWTIGVPRMDERKVYILSEL